MTKPATPADLRALAAFYRDVARELRERAQQRLVRDARKLTAEARRARALLVEVEGILQELDRFSATWIAKSIPQAYRQGIRDVDAGLAEIGAPIATRLDTQIHQEAVQVLVNDLQDTLLDATARAEKGYRAVVRRTQLQAVVDKKITTEIAKGVAAGKARREVSSALRERLIKELGDRPLRIGGRNYQIDKYAEMVARTKTAEAQTAGTVNRMIEAGEDLVMITSHGAKDGCGFYEGKIFSISGTHEKYPPLDSTPNGGPPFHPNCRHALVPFIEDLASGAEKRRGKGVPDEALGKSYAEVEKLAARRE